MKYRLLSFVAFTILTSTYLNAQVQWDGGAETNLWHDDQNWSDDTIPDGSDTVVFDVDTNFRKSQQGTPYLVDIQGQTVYAKNLIIDVTNFELSDRGKNKNKQNLRLLENITVTPNYNPSTPRMSLFRSIDLVGSYGDHFIINNAVDAWVIFSNIKFSGKGANWTISGGDGTGRITIQNRSTILDQVYLFVLDDEYEGTIRWENNNVANGIDPSNSMRIRGGRFELNGSDLIADDLSIAIEDIDGNGAVLAFLDSINETMGALYVSEKGGTLEINDSKLTFSALGSEPEGNLDITNWNKNISSLTFTDIAEFSETGSLVSDGTAVPLKRITIDGERAYLIIEGNGGYLSPDKNTK